MFSDPISTSDAHTSRLSFTWAAPIRWRWWNLEGDGGKLERSVLKFVDPQSQSAKVFCVAALVIRERENKTWEERCWYFQAHNVEVATYEYFKDFDRLSLPRLYHGIPFESKVIWSYEWYPKQVYYRIKLTVKSVWSMWRTRVWWVSPSVTILNKWHRCED